jgi:hypothetical protein
LFPFLGAFWPASVLEWGTPVERRSSRPLATPGITVTNLDQTSTEKLDSRQLFLLPPQGLNNQELKDIRLRRHEYQRDSEMPAFTQVLQTLLELIISRITFD